MAVLTPANVWALLTLAEQTALQNNGFSQVDTVRMFRLVNRLSAARVNTLLTAFNAMTAVVAATVTGSATFVDLPLQDGRFWVSITHSLSDGTIRGPVPILCAQNTDIPALITTQATAMNAQLVAEASYP